MSPPAKATTSGSPISQLLNTLGLKREDLAQRASHMRQFLGSTDLVERAHSQDEVAQDPYHHILLDSQTIFPQSRAQNLEHAPARETKPLPTRRSNRRATPTTPPQPQAPIPFLFASSSRDATTSYADESDQSTDWSSKKIKREHEQHRRSHASASSSRPKPSLDEIMQMRSSQSRRVSSSEESDDSGDESLRDVFARRQGQATPRYRYPHPSRAQTQSYNKYYKQESPVLFMNGNYYRDRDTSVPPSTPQTNGRIPKANPVISSEQASVPNTYYRQTYDLPSSSPTIPSSPISSPPRLIVNIVSSPGPMSDPPDQNDSNMPYILPPGPYSKEKPELSYAALIGQAILASHNHALRLKDIYDYISTVYPFYRRDGHSHSQKWMNAIRQNLTITPQFYKRDLPSGRPSKGSLWCISPENLPCFANGGFNRHALNPDSVQSVKAEKRKRRKDERQIDEKTKKVRVTTPAMENPFTFPYGYPQAGRSSMFNQSIKAQVQADLIFPPLPSNHPSAHLINQGLSSSDSLDRDILFPPLPAGSQTRIAREQRMELSRQSSTSSFTEDYSQAPSDDDSPVSAPPMSSASSSVSVPDLTPNNSSSSPPEPDEEEDNELMYINEDVKSESQSSHEDEEVHEEWKDHDNKSETVEEISFPPLPHIPSSPTMSRRGAGLMRSPSTSLYATSGFLGYAQFSTARPCTPPNEFSGYLESSLTMTPLAKRNLPATPTRGTSQYKGSRSTDESGDDRPNFLNAVPRTPSRRPAESSNVAGPSTLPETPMRIFSPFGTFSPFRTPSRRGIFDAVDPRTMLDEELSALASARQRGPQDSPVGLFPRGGGYLYESPNLPSPDKWRPW